MKKLYILVNLRQVFVFSLIATFYQNNFSQSNNLVISVNDSLIINKNESFDSFRMEDNSILVIRSTIDTVKIDTNRFIFGQNCKIIILGENGANGANGQGYVSASECQHGRHGRNGESGVNGKKPPVLVLKGSVAEIGSIKIESKGGNGGNGGNGGKGERGGNADHDTFDCACGPGDGGNGGNGGNAGEGGKGSDVLLFYDVEDDLAMQLVDKIEYTSLSGNPGIPGNAGNGGLEGPARSWCKPDGLDGRSGRSGQLITTKRKNGKLRYIRFINELCAEFLVTHAFVISAYKDENDQFYKAKNDFINSLKQNLSQIFVHDLSNLSKKNIIDLFDSLKDGTLDEIDDPDSTQILICFIGHGLYDKLSKSLYFLSEPQSEKILIDDVVSRIEKTPFKNKLTIINSCSSGTILNDYPFSSTGIIPFFPSTLNETIKAYACWGNSSKYITSSYNIERSSKIDFIYGIINQINSLEQYLTTDQLFKRMMSSEFRMDGVRPVIGKSSNSESKSSFLFIKSKT